MKNTNPGVMSHLNVMLRGLAFIQTGSFEYSIFFLNIFFLNYDESVSYQICSFNNKGTQDPVSRTIHNGICNTYSGSCSFRTFAKNRGSVIVLHCRYITWRKYG